VIIQKIVPCTFPSTWITVPTAPMSTSLEGLVADEDDSGTAVFGLFTYVCLF
jgi:hypothetical protein